MRLKGGLVDEGGLAARACNCGMKELKALKHFQELNFIG